MEIIRNNDPNMNRMDRAALGLPLIYKEGWEVQAVRENGEQLRRASPLWLRPVGQDNDWRLFSFRFHSSFLPDGEDDEAVSVELSQGKKRDRTLDVRTEDAHNLTDQWIKALSKGRSFVRGTIPDRKALP